MITMMIKKMTTIMNDNDYHVMVRKKMMMMIVMIFLDYLKPNRKPAQERYNLFIKKWEACLAPVV